MTARRVAVRSITAVAAAALIASGLVGCSRTVEGMATTAGTPDSTAETRIAPPSTRSSAPRSTPSRTPSAGPPGDVMTMTCADYNDLAVADKQAAIEEIIAQGGSSAPPDAVDVAKGLADIMCQFMPDQVLSDVLLGLSPP